MISSWIDRLNSGEIGENYFYFSQVQENGVLSDVRKFSFFTNHTKGSVKLSDPLEAMNVGTEPVMEIEKNNLQINWMHRIRKKKH